MPYFCVRLAIKYPLLKGGNLVQHTGPTTTFFFQFSFLKKISFLYLFLFSESPLKKKEENPINIMLFIHERDDLKNPIQLKVNKSIRMNCTEELIYYLNWWKSPFRDIHFDITTSDAISSFMKFPFLPLVIRFVVMIYFDLNHPSMNIPDARLDVAVTNATSLLQPSSSLTHNEHNCNFSKFFNSVNFFFCFFFILTLLLMAIENKQSKLNIADRCIGPGWRGDSNQMQRNETVINQNDSFPNDS